MARRTDTGKYHVPIDKSHNACIFISALAQTITKFGFYLFLYMYYNIQGGY